MSVSEIIDRVNDFACDHVVITGGEPMIAKDIRYLVSRLKMHALHVTIETAATIKPEGIEVDLASLSPKLSNSTPSEVLAGPWSEKHERLRMQPDVIAEWLNWYHCQLKFVVATEQDVAEILALLKVLQDHDIERSQIMLMPEGVDSATLKSRSGWVSNLCKEYGWRYCQRLQIELYGNTKGT
jgi:7-carboxy-7-deazaguanine synthase